MSTLKTLYFKAHCTTHRSLQARFLQELKTPNKSHDFIIPYFHLNKTGKLDFQENFILDVFHNA